MSVPPLELTVDAPPSAAGATPIADAGPDQTVVETALVYLDGHGTGGTVNESLQFQWAQVAGPDVVLLNPDAPDARFAAPNVDQDVDLHFTLTVTVGTAAAVDTVIIHVANTTDPAGQTCPVTFVVWSDGTAPGDPVVGPVPLTLHMAVVTIDAPSPPEGSYMWFIDGTDNTGPVHTHASRTHMVTAVGMHTVSLSILLAGATTPLACVTAEHGDQVVHVQGQQPDDGTDPNGACPDGCDDGNPCTAGVCVDGVCAYPTLADGTACTDGLYCNGFETCHAGVCTPGTPPCPDAALCNETDDTCLECTADAHCDDADPCTTDACAAGACQHAPMTCPIGHACVSGACIVQTAVTGHILDRDGLPAAGIELLADNDTGTTTTDGDGFYELTVPDGWSGTITSGENHRLDPPERAYTNVTSVILDQDFVAYRNLYVDDDADTHPTFDPTAPPGYITNPFTTIQHAADATKPGDTVYIRAGTYVPTPASEDWVVAVNIAGAPDAPITYRNYNNEPVRIDINDRLHGFVVYRDYIIIQGLEITGGRRTGILFLDASFGTAADNVVHDIRDTTSVNVTSVSGIRAAGTYSSVTFRGNDVYDCSIGLRLDGPAQGNLVERNYVHDIHWWDATGTFNDKNADGLPAGLQTATTIRDNVFARCGDDGLDVYDSLQCIVRRNVCFNIGDGVSGSPADANGDGNGIKSTTGGGGGHVFENNIAFNNEARGFDQDHVDPAAPGNTYYNNIAYGNGAWGWLIEKTSTTDTLLRNNIGYLNATKDVRIKLTAPADTDYNFWADGVWPNDAVQIEFPTPTGHSLSGDPRFVDPPPPGVALVAPETVVNLDLTSPDFGVVPGFFLQRIADGHAADSPCLDAGTDIGQPFTGPAPDIGAYEAP
ncbi:MAG: right-handed parallel beta-helix repeat-containing protein [Phycisphaerae bacterium]